VSTNLHAFAHDGQRLPWPTGSGSLTYEPYFGLREKPFSLSADPRFLFKSPAHAPAFEQLHAGIRRREGLIVLTGDIGTGKTTLCRAVLEHLDRRTFSTFVPDPFVSREDLLKMLLVDFGVMSVEDVKSGRLRNASRAELSYPLYEFLNSLVPLQAFAVLVIDEAQNLPLPLLEEIRILSDLEGREKLLQVVLVGQPELRASLKLPQMRQVDQRVSVRCELAPLASDDVARYVTWRLNVAAGGTCDGVQFTRDAIDLVYHASAGVPRLINRICDRALHEAHAIPTASVGPDAVAAALTHLGMEDALPELPQPVAPNRAVAAAPAPADVEVASGPVAEFASEASRPARGGQTFPIRRSWRETIGGRPRPLAMVALTGVALSAATLAASSWYRLAPQARAAEPASLPAAPPSPTLPRPSAFAPASLDEIARVTAASSAAKYIIQVASFEDERRAGQLVAQLAAAGYRAYQAPFELDGERWWQVSVGPYGTAGEAQSDLTRVQEIPGYEDAAVRSVARP
jgi:general secretion pathway protein A